ncbi:hypothetical protein KIL84_003511 [Mauremys mutica]|uniref:Uncharacterized protein n=1 Tax=Mauremys mutica TaxID=74926 RepID=A0A9D4AR99_9SAUR|nr:hypothetical protein KIL84_003511 [Mauremys mutica]
MAAEGQAIRVSSQSYGAVDQMSHASAEGYFGAIVPDDITSGEEPSAPPAYPMDDVSGYEGTALGDGGGKGLPPPSDLVTDRGGGPPPPQTDWNIPAVSEDAAKEALIQYAASRCCYSSAPAKEMVFRTLQPFNTYRYRLETFTESRSSEWKTTPYKGAIVPDDITSGEEPSAPPAYPMDDVSGYEGTALGDGGGKGLPPPSDLVTDRGGGPPPPQTDWNIPAVSEDAAKEALIQYAASRCCYSSAPAKEMVFRTLQPFNTYRYRLETFTESRSSEWKTTPYKALNSCGPNPGGCSYPVSTDIAGIQPRSGFGLVVGNIWTLIHVLRWRAAIIVDVQVQFAAQSVMEEERNNNIFEYVADQRSGFPADLFKEVTGQKMFVDEQSMVYPVVNFPDPSISQASQNALVQHHTQFASTSRVLRQRQTIELIPLTKVEYEWQGKRYSYYVYGDENRVYAENYPKKCCCSIM